MMQVTYGGKGECYEAHKRWCDSLHNRIHETQTIRRNTMNCQIFDTAPRTLTRLSRRLLILLILPLALGATHVYAQATDQSVDVPIGGGTYYFTAADFGLTSGAVLVFSYPANGRLIDIRTNIMVALAGDGDGQTFIYLASDLTGTSSSQGVSYTPPVTAISVANGYDSFTFAIQTGGVDSKATMTINLIGALAQTAASGAPAIATATDTHRISASITGVTDLNGIDVSTLSWQWQQADAPASGVPAPSAYSDIAGATYSSDFAPTAAQLGRYVRACVSFKDQFSMPASEGPLCSTDAHQVTQLPPDIRLRLRLFLEGPLR